MSRSGIIPYPVPCAQQRRHAVGQPATSMHSYSIAVVPRSPGPVAAKPSPTGQSSHDRPQAPNPFFGGGILAIAGSQLRVARDARSSPPSPPWPVVPARPTARRWYRTGRRGRGHGSGIPARRIWRSRPRQGRQARSTPGAGGHRHLSATRSPLTSQAGTPGMTRSMQVTQATHALAGTRLCPWSPQARRNGRNEGQRICSRSTSAGNSDSHADGPSPIVRNMMASIPSCTRGRGLLPPHTR
jgi:hypothetical protein